MNLELADKVVLVTEVGRFRRLTAKQQITLMLAKFGVDKGTGFQTKFNGASWNGTNLSGFSTVEACFQPLVYPPQRQDAAATFA